MIVTFRMTFLPLVIALLIGLGINYSRASTSNWVEFPGGKARLIISTIAKGEITAGLELDLEKGWKTYWRYPGETGIPTDIDFSGSQNLEGLSVLWPFPTRYFDGYSESIIYEGTVILPIRGRQIRQTVPGLMAARVDLGICKDICMPLFFELSIRIAPFDQHDEIQTKRTEAFLTKVPDRITNHGFQIVQDTNHSDQILISVEHTNKGSRQDLFAAAHGEDYPGLPQLIEAKPGKTIYSLRRDGLSPVGNQIDLVFHDGERAYSATLSYPPK